MEESWAHSSFSFQPTVAQEWTCCHSSLKKGRKEEEKTGQKKAIKRPNEMKKKGKPHLNMTMTEASGPVCGQKVVLGAILRKKKSNEKKKWKNVGFCSRKNRKKMEEKSTWKLIEEKEACMKRPGCGQWAEISARSRLKRKDKKKEREKIIKREKNQPSWKCRVQNSALSRQGKVWARQHREEGLGRCWEWNERERGTWKNKNEKKTNKKTRPQIPPHLLRIPWVISPREKTRVSCVPSSFFFFELQFE